MRKSRECIGVIAVNIEPGFELIDLDFAGASFADGSPLVRFVTRLLLCPFEPSRINIHFNRTEYPKGSFAVTSRRSVGGYDVERVDKFTLTDPSINEDDELEYDIINNRNPVADFAAANAATLARISRSLVTATT